MTDTLSSTDTQASTDHKDEQQQSKIVVTQTDPVEQPEQEQEEKHPDGCCGSCT